MRLILNFLANTPIYVYFIFAYLISVGIHASKVRVVSLYRPGIIACVFLYLSISSIIKMKLGILYCSVFMMVLLSSFWLGWLLTAKKNILFDHEKRLMRLPGSWITLYLVLITFASKYYLGYQNFLDPSFMLESQAKWLTISSSGFSVGLIFGRFANYIYRFNVDPHTELSRKNANSI